jgi:hypothetical protein
MPPPQKKHVTVSVRTPIDLQLGLGAWLAWLRACLLRNPEFKTLALL